MNIPQMPPLLTWWEEVNNHLAEAGAPEMLYGDARYWYDRQHSPGTAAQLHLEENAP